MELREDGSVIEGSIQLVKPDPIPDGRFDAAYRAARRALIRCSPYSGLPPEKYSHWRSFDAVFNPEGMVSF